MVLGEVCLSVAIDNVCKRMDAATIPDAGERLSASGARLSGYSLWGYSDFCVRMWNGTASGKR